MATYTVIQDIEAEDKLVGPLSLRQFIYAAIAAICAYLSFVSLTKGASFLLIIFVPVMLFTGFFAAPFGRDQPTEVWALAKIRFFIKPRRRLWDQSGIKNLVNITAPKQIEKNYTNGLTQTEIHSRLRALANTIDSRGWAIKNVNANLYDPTLSPLSQDSDRLIDPSSLPQEVSQFDVLASDDILDESNNPVAQNLDRLVHTSSVAHRQQLISKLRQQANLAKPASNIQLPAPADYWFLNQPLDLSKSSNAAKLPPTTIVAPGSTEETTRLSALEPSPNEVALDKKLKANRQDLQAINYQHMKTIQPIGANTTRVNPQSAKSTGSAPVTPSVNPDKMLLANRNDLNIATIGRIANNQDEQPDEVVISLHDHAS
jgi:hypothetical protein